MSHPQAPYSAKLHCCVCSEPISALWQRQQAATEFPHCQSFDCSRFIEQRRNLPENLFRAQLESVSAQYRERKAAQLEREEKIRARVEAEEQENQQLLDALLKTRPELAEQDIHRTVIPSGRKRIAPVTPQRMENYRAHLQKTVAAAENVVSAAEIVEDQNLHYAADSHRNNNCFHRTPALQSVSDRLCTMCRGACCSSGGDHAYLSPLILRRILDNNPELRGDDIVAWYTSSVTAETIEGSCINQTATGCSLPRKLRSDTCNAYYCDAILNYHRDSNEAGEARNVFAIQREATFAGTIDPDTPNGVLATALVTEGGVERFREESG